jgi:glycosyltransferase involved in cell wall biosynthesis
LVDDFSSDKSLKIINNMAEKDSRIKIIRNKKNRGSLYSRSIGTLNSKGRYIMALDSDDIFSNEFLFYKCYKESEKNDLDILEFSGFRVKKTILRLNQKLPNVPFYLRYKIYNKIIKQPKLFNSLYRRNGTKIIRLRDAYIWGKCIRKNIYIKTLQILGETVYTRNINFGEDRIVNLYLVSKNLNIIYFRLF